MYYTIIACILIPPNNICVYTYQPTTAGRRPPLGHWSAKPLQLYIGQRFTAPPDNCGGLRPFLSACQVCLSWRRAFLRLRKNIKLLPPNSVALWPFFRPSFLSHH